MDDPANLLDDRVPVTCYDLAVATVGRAPSEATRWSEVTVVAHAANHFRCAPAWHLPERTRANYQLWLVTSGGARFSFGPGAGADIGMRSALLIPPGTPHRARHDPADPLRCFVIHFLGHRYGRPSTLLWPTGVTTGFGDGTWSALLDNARELCHELADPTPESGLLGNAAIGALLGGIRRAERLGEATFRRLGSDQAVPATVAAVLEYIGEHYAEDISADDLGNVAALSPGYLNDLFRRTVGMSPVQYVRRYRLDRAKYLLEETDLSVREIADRVGYPDAFYFSRVFRQSEGLAPSRYRAMRAGDQV